MMLPARLNFREFPLIFSGKLKFPIIIYAARRSSTVTRVLTADFRGTGKSLPKLSSNAAFATIRRTSEKAK